MASCHLLTINLNEQCSIDAGSWQECVAEVQRSSRLVSPPRTTMYRQVLSYLEEAMGDQRDPPQSRLHFGEVAIATVAVCLRWSTATCRCGPPRLIPRSAASVTGRWPASTSRPRRPSATGSA